MKKLLVLTSLLFLAACSKEAKTIVGEDSELKLSANEIVLTPGQQNQATKANEQLEDGNLGVYIVTPGGGTPDFATAVRSNHLFTSTGGTIATANPVILRAGTNYGIYAYLPQVDPLTDPTAISVAHNADMLWASQAQTSTAGTTSVNLLFQHAVAQLKFTLVSAPTMVVDLTNATIEVDGFYSSATMNLATGVLTPGTIDNTIKFTTLDTPVCMIPTGLANQEFAVEVVVPVPNTGAGTYTGTITDTYQPGYLYSYTITVSSYNSELGFTAEKKAWEIEQRTGEVID